MERRVDTGRSMRCGAFVGVRRWPSIDISTQARMTLARSPPVGRRSAAGS